MKFAGLIGENEGIEEALKSSFGGKSKVAALKECRERFYPLLDRSEKIAKYTELSDEEKRRFIQELHTEDLTYTEWQDAPRGSFGSMGGGYGGSVHKQRDMTDEEFELWEKDFLMTDYVNACNNAMQFTRNNDNLSFAIRLALSDPDDRDNLKQLLKGKSTEDKKEIYMAALAFNKEVGAWNIAARQ